MKKVRFISNNLKDVHELYGKKMLGSEWSKGDFYLCQRAFVSKVWTEIIWLVVDGEGMFCIGVGNTKDEAIKSARSVHKHYSNAKFREFSKRYVDAWNRMQVEADALFQKIRSGERSGKNVKRAAVLSKTDGKCFYCDVVLVGEWHVDHHIPKSKGGSNDIANLVPACRKCNLSKSDLMPEQFAAKKAAA